MDMKKIVLLLYVLLCGAIQGIWAESVEFVERSWDLNGKKVVETEVTKDATVLTGDPGEWMMLGSATDQEDHYYMVKGNVEYQTLNVFGRAHLILCDGSSLKCTGGIKVEKANNNAKIFIYGQSQNTGKLTVTNSYQRAAGIGSSIGSDCGEITIHGGILDVTGAQYAAGIGAGGTNDNYSHDETNAGTTTIYGGEVTAHGGDSGAGIGGGSSCESLLSHGGTFKLYGGTVTATGGELAAGVGGGGGFRHLQKNKLGRCGNGGKIYIYGGTLTAQGGFRASGIGAGNNGDGEDTSWDKETEVIIYDGTVNATGGDYGAGIGGGCNCNGGKVYILNGTVTAKGGEDAAGIGGGEDGWGGELHVSGGTVRAEGTGCGAGIGGGECTGQFTIVTAKGADTYITGGIVTAIAGNECKGRDAKGGSAIGGGQGLKNKDDSDRAKVLEIPGNYMVTGGDAENNIERVFTNGERIAACRWRNFVRIEPCTHTTPTVGSDHSEALTYSIDYDDPDDNTTSLSHTKHCRYCSKTVTELHVDYGTCVCGVNIIGYTLSLYVPDTEKGSGYRKLESYTLGKGKDFYLPVCEVVPEGYTFLGWEMNPDTNVEDNPTCYDWAAYMGGDPGGDDKIKGGTSVRTIEGMTDADFYARYLFDIDVEWMWDTNNPVAYTTVSYSYTGLSTPSALKPTITYEPLTGRDGSEIGIRYKGTAKLTLNGYEYTFTDDFDQYDIVKLSLSDDASNDQTLKDNEEYHANVTLNGRTLLTDGSWNTLCLPFDIDDISTTPLSGATIKRLVSSAYDSATNILTLNFGDVESIVAGKPFIIRWDNNGEGDGSNVANPIFRDVVISAIHTDIVDTECVDFAGSFSPVALDANDHSVLYLGADNKLYFPSVDMTVGSCRAIFRLSNEVIENLSQQSAASFVLNFGDEATGIEDVETSVSGSGIHACGKSREAWYSLDGRKWSGRPTGKGVYVNNGQKVVIR